MTSFATPRGGGNVFGRGRGGGITGANLIPLGDGSNNGGDHQTITSGRGRGFGGRGGGGSDFNARPMLQQEQISNGTALGDSEGGDRQTVTNGRGRGVGRGGRGGGGGSDFGARPSFQQEQGQTANGATWGGSEGGDQQTVTSGRGRGFGRGGRGGGGGSDFSAKPMLQQEQAANGAVWGDSGVGDLQTVASGRGRGVGRGGRGGGRGSDFGAKPAFQQGQPANGAVWGDDSGGGDRQPISSGRGRGVGRGGRDGGGSDFGAGQAANGAVWGDSGGANHQNHSGEGGQQNQQIDMTAIVREERIKAPSEIPHVHKIRAVDELYAENAKIKEKYANIREEDNDISVTGPNSANYHGLETWREFGFGQKLLENIEKCGWIRPRKIQSFAIPLIKEGLDVKGHAETASGKSAAFLLPIIDKIMKKKQEGEIVSKRGAPFALIIEPTRELTIQIHEESQKLANDCDVTTSLAYGGFKRILNMRSISVDGCDILIGTPGRLLDFFKSGNLICDNLKMLVFDEADELLQDDFVVALREIEKEARNWPKIEDRQTLLFSATFPKVVQEWADDWMRNDAMMVSNRRLVAANTRIEQLFIVVPFANKKDALAKILELELAKEKERNPDNPKVRNTMVFVNTKREADLVSTFLNQFPGLSTTTINGDRTQEMRELSLSEFREGKHQVIVSTDVCARGHDIPSLDWVINMDMPSIGRPEDDYTTYVQRIGRTGRLWKGLSTSFIDPEKDVPICGDLIKGLRDAGLQVQVPEWLQEAANGNMPMSQGMPSDEELLRSAGF